MWVVPLVVPLVVTRSEVEAPRFGKRIGSAKSVTTSFWPVMIYESSWVSSLNVVIQRRACAGNCSMSWELNAVLPYTQTPRDR